MEAIKAVFVSLLTNHKLNLTVLGLLFTALGAYFSGNPELAATSLTGAIAAAIAKFMTPKPPDKPQDPPSSPAPAKTIRIEDHFRQYIIAAMVAFGFWNVGHALSATRTPACVEAAEAAAVKCEECDKPGCKCGCALGQKCTCHLIEASKFPNLPSHAACETNHKLACMYCESLEKLLDFISGREVIEMEEDCGCICGCCEPIRGEVIAGGWKAEAIQADLVEAKRRRAIWLKALTATDPSFSAAAQQENADELRGIVGDRAFWTGELPDPLP